MERETKNKEKNFFQVKIVTYLKFMFLTYMGLAAIYTAIQIGSGNFQMDVFGLRLEVTNAMISPLPEE